MQPDDWLEQQRKFYSTIERSTKPELEHPDYKMFLKYIKKGDRVLELGCNTGEVLQWLNDNMDCYVRGYDIITSTKPFVFMRDLNFGIVDTDFDVVCCFGTIEHLYDDWMLLCSIKLCLKNNGYFIISIPTAQDVSPNHLRYYPEIEFERLMALTGLTLVEKTKHPDYPNQQHRIWVYKNEKI